MDQASGLHTGDTGDLEQVGLGNGGNHDGVAVGAHIHVQEEAIPHLVACTVVHIWTGFKFKEEEK